MNKIIIIYILNYKLIIIKNKINNYNILHQEVNNTNKAYNAFIAEIIS